MDRCDLAWFFERREIETRHIPMDVLARARRVVERLEHSDNYQSMHGKRLHCNRNLVSIPLGRRWRILADDVGDHLHVRAVMSHQKYNSSLNIF